MKHPIKKLVFIIFYLLAPRLSVLATSTNKKWHKAFTTLYCINWKNNNKPNTQKIIKLFETLFNNKKDIKNIVPKDLNSNKQALTKFQEACLQIYFYIRNTETLNQYRGLANNHSKTQTPVIGSIFAKPPIWLFFGLVIGYLACLFFNRLTKSTKKPQKSNQKSKK